MMAFEAASSHSVNIKESQADYYVVQFETQKPNDTSGIRLCHTSCDLLDVGTLQSYLTTVRGWLDAHPYEVIAIIMGNNNGQSTRIPATEYVAPFEQAGMMKYLWTPPSSTLNLTGWPTLGEMILRNQRVVVMMDYGTDQSQVPWLLSEFDYQWETPFSPTDPAFPCTQQRPPNQEEDVSRERMYMMNHNLNIDIQLSGTSILIPAYSLLDQVNAVSGNGSLGLNVQNCEKMWGGRRTGCLSIITTLAISTARSSKLLRLPTMSSTTTLPAAELNRPVEPKVYWRTLWFFFGV
jgi:hypothetical protein